MKATIDVRNRDEGDTIRLALEDPETRVYVLVLGLLLQLDDAARVRILASVDTHLMSRNGGHRPVQEGAREFRLHDADTGE